MTMSPTPTRLYRLRMLQDIAQETVAERAGITQAYLSYLESGRRGGCPAVHRRLARAYRVPVGWLFYGEGRDADYLIPSRPVADRR